MKKLVTYIGRPFEQSTDEHTKTGDWVDKIKKGFDRRKIYIYDPATQESIKTGVKLNKHIDSTHIMFINKEYDKLEEEMSLIWYGQKQCPENIDIWLKNIRNDKLCNSIGDPDTWGDYEAVLKSDFIIARIPYGSYTVGTYFEIFTAMLFKIPIYLIIPDLKYKSRIDKSKAFNKTLFKAVVNSGGRWFWCVEDAIRIIKKKYKI